MPRRCCVPGCKSNYDSVLKQSKKVISTFSFPKDQHRIVKWTKAIPRKDWIPTKNSVVCANHFIDDHIIRFETFTTPNGDIKKVPLKYPKLKESAVPSIFNNLPKYLSLSQEKNTRKDPELRRKMNLQRCEEEIDNFLQEDMIRDYEHFINNFKSKLNIFPWEIKEVEKFMSHFIVLCFIIVSYLCLLFVTFFHKTGSV